MQQQQTTMTTRTVEVKHLSDLASEREIHEFFSFSGEIQRIDIQRENGQGKVAFVTFKDPKALEIALLLSGATIVDQVVSITPVENYVPKQELQEERRVDNSISVMDAENFPSDFEGKSSPSENGRVYVIKAQEVVTNMLAKGSAIHQDAVNKAKAFDKKHHLTANASARVISLDRRVGLTEKLTVGISVVNERVKSVDQRFHVSDKTMAAIFAAERKINDTGSAVKSSRLNFFIENPKNGPPETSVRVYDMAGKLTVGAEGYLLLKYVTAGTAWLNGAFTKVARAGQVAGTKTREKFNLAVSNLTAKEAPIAV